MNNKERILSTIRGQEPDCVPIAPELWYYIPARLTGRPFFEVGEGYGIETKLLKVSSWQAQLDAARYFGTAAFLAPNLGPSDKQALRVKIDKISRDSKIAYLFRCEYKSPRGTIKQVVMAEEDESQSVVERYVKDFERDWPIYEELFFVDPWTHDVSAINDAVTKTADDGVVAGPAGVLFFHFLSEAREGNVEQTIYDLFGYPQYIEKLHKRYIEYMVERAKMILEKTHVDELFIACGNSELPILSPSLWEKWEVPLLKSLSEVTTKHHVPLHLHQHGSCMKLLSLIADAGVDEICPFESAPFGDTNLKEVKQKVGNRLTIKGNVSPVILYEGSSQDIKQAVRDCIRVAGQGGRFILGTADQVMRDTSFENIRQYVAAAKEFGKYPIAL